MAKPKFGLPYTDSEKSLLKEYAGKLPKKELAAMLKRSEASLQVQARKLEVSLRMVGEDHWNAKLTNLQVQMIDSLVVCGFSCAEIHEGLFPDLSRHTIYAVIAKYNRKRR